MQARPPVPTATSGIRTGFTVIELMVSVLVISLLASLVLYAMSGAVEMAYKARTKSRIARIDRVISRMWRDYETRRVPIRITPGTDPKIAAAIRLDALRELMRLEMPDRITDVRDDPYVHSFPEFQLMTLTKPALSWAYSRSNQNTWTPQFQGAECLYLILSKAKDGGRPAIAGFSKESIGDVDDDGMPEILDAWGNPINFLRWPAGRRADPGEDGAWGVEGQDDDGDGIEDNSTEALSPDSDDVRSLPTINSVSVPDPFDRRKIDPRWHDSDLTNDPFLLYPIIYSAGPDREYNIYNRDLKVPIHYTDRVNGHSADPYMEVNRLQFGSILIPDSDGAADNIHNHFLESR